MLPPHRYEQAEITAAVADRLGLSGQKRAMLERFHAASGVRSRHLAAAARALPKDHRLPAGQRHLPGQRNRPGEQAVKEALAHVGLLPTDIDVLMTVFVTGIGAPLD